MKQVHFKYLCYHNTYPMTKPFNVITSSIYIKCKIYNIHWFYTLSLFHLIPHVSELLCRVISFKMQSSMAPLLSTKANHGLHNRMHTLQASDNQWPLQLPQRYKAKDHPRKLVPLKYLRLESWTKMGNATHLDHLQCHLDLGKIIRSKLSEI